MHFEIPCGLNAGTPFLQIHMLEPSTQWNNIKKWDEISLSEPSDPSICEEAAGKYHI